MTYAKLKALISSKGLGWQYEDEPLFRRYFAYDGLEKYGARTHTGDPSWPDGFTEEQKAAELADLADFDANYKAGANQRISATSSDGIPQVNSIPAIDATMACFCPATAGEVSIATPYVDYAVASSYVQLAGIELQVTGAELWDELRFQVGMVVGGNYILISEYGGKKLITPNWDLHFISPLRSNAVPQGLKLRIAMIFANPETANKPKISVMYHLWRPYA